VLNFSIQRKITLLASFSLVLIVGLLVGLSLYQTRASTERVKDSSAKMLADAARLNLESQGKAQALRIQQGFTRTMNLGWGSLDTYSIYVSVPKPVRSRQTNFAKPLRVSYARP